MANELLFYSSATPISLQRHKDWGVEAVVHFGFAAKTNAVPVMALEFFQVAKEYVVVFAGDEKRVRPAAILGINDDTNLYVDENGKWTAKYIPAFVRRYPFVFSRSEDGQTFTLCVDEDYAGANDEGRGNRLFSDDGERTEYLNNVLDFSKEYQSEFNRTHLFCQKLLELGLLEPMQVQIKMNTGQEVSLSGFQTVSREKLKGLPAEALAELVKNGALELIYLHLFSMRNFDEMTERLAKTLSNEGSDEGRN